MPTTDMPPEIARCIGEDQFGPAYRVMLAGDAHAPRSVDRVLFQRMIRLGTATADYLYASYTPTTLRYRHGSRPKLERFLGEATSGATAPEEVVDGIARWCAVIAHADDGLSLDDLRLGGAEEAIVGRRVPTGAPTWPALAVCCAKSPGCRPGWCTCSTRRRPTAVMQSSKCCARGRWGCVDVVHGVVYRHEDDGTPASTWDLPARSRT